MRLVGCSEDFRGHQRIPDDFGELQRTSENFGGPLRTSPDFIYFQRTPGNFAEPPEEAIGLPEETPGGPWAPGGACGPPRRAFRAS